MTDVFKRYDSDRDGYITLSFEEFLTGEFRVWIFFRFNPVLEDVYSSYNEKACFDDVFLSRAYDMASSQKLTLAAEILNQR